jgi:aminoglycoside phosphotransferase (APT) family kinase protein
VQSLLRDAGVYDPPDPLTLLGISTCSVWRLTAGAQSFVLRYRLDNQPQLAYKEAYIGELLHRQAVPAPRVVAIATSDQKVATLSTWLPGIRLDQARMHISSSDLSSAWRSVGAALRRAHAISLPVAGEIVLDRVEPFVGGWAQWVLADLATDLSWLQAALGVPSSSRSRLEGVITAALAALAEAPVRLIHNDALPQNVLVAPGADGWRCSGWLDWEFARAADPYWDVATFDFRPAGLVPAAFYEGYGEPPREPAASIYDLLMATWRTRVELERGSDWLWPPQQARIAYLQSLPSHIDRLAALLQLSP